MRGTPHQLQTVCVSTLCKFLLLQVDPLYAGIFISSMAFPALASIFKEKIFAGTGPA